MSTRGRMEARITVPSSPAWTATVNDGGAGGATVATVAAGTYYLSGTGVSDSLLDAIDTAFSTATGASWTITASVGESGTGKVTIEAALTPFDVTWTNTDFRDAIGFTANISGASTPQTGANQAVGIWLPDCPGMFPLGRDDIGRRRSDARYTRSPLGHVLTLAGNIRRELADVEWPLVSLARVRQRAESTVNQSLESFWRNCHVGEKSYFPVGAPIRLWRDAAAAATAGTNYKIVGWSDCPGEPAQAGWDGLWRVRVPLLSEVPA